MNDTYLRFILLKENRVIEVSFDKRLSFRENLNIYKDYDRTDVDNLNVYDDERGIFLNMDISISEMKIERFTKFYLL